MMNWTVSYHSNKCVKDIENQLQLLIICLEKYKLLEEKFNKLKEVYTKLREEHITLLRQVLKYYTNYFALFRCVHCFSSL